MRIKLIVCILLFINSLYAQEMLDLEYEKLNVRSNFEWDTDPTAVTTYGYDDIENWNDGYILWNTYQNKFQILNSDFTVVEETKVDIIEKTYATFKMVKSEKYLILIKENFQAYIFDENLEYISGFKIWDFGLSDPASYDLKNMSVRDNLILLENSTTIAQYHSFEIPNIEGEDVIYRNPRDTKSFIESLDMQKSDLRFNSNGFLLSETQLLTKDIDSFNTYFGDGVKLLSSAYYFISYNDGQYFWSNGVWTKIFDNDGNLKIKIKARTIFPSSNVQIDTKGNLYYFSYNQQTRYLDFYRLEKSW